MSEGGPGPGPGPTRREERSAEVAEFMRRWARDLSTCSEEELRFRWGSVEERGAVDRLDPLGFERRVRGHSWLYYLAERVFFDNVRGDRSYLDAGFHRDLICKPTETYLQSDGRAEPGLVCVAQRDSFKSSFFHGVLPVAFSLRRYNLFHEHARVCLVHEKELQASGSLVRIKQRTSGSDWFRDIWGADKDGPGFWCGEDIGTKTSFTWPCVPPGLFQEPSLVAAGLGADLTGWHFDLVCYSDLVNKDHRWQRALRDAVQRDFSGMIHVRDTRRSWVTVDGTLYHPSDQNARLLAAKNGKGEPLYKTIVLGAGGKRAEKPLTLPQRHSEAVLEARRLEIISTDGNDDMWWLQYQNIINSQRMMVASTSWIRHCNQRDIPTEGFLVLLVDPAWKGSWNYGKGDHAAGELWKCVRKGSLVHRYLVDGFYSNEMSADAGTREILRLCRKYGCMHVAPEERGGAGYRTQLRLDAVSAGLPIEVLNLKSMTRKKADRAASFISLLEAGLVWFCEEAEPGLVEALTQQISIFPACIDDEDDAIDCAGYLNDPVVLDLYSNAFPEVDNSPWNRIMRQRMEQMDAPVTRYGVN